MTIRSITMVRDNDDMDVEVDTEERCVWLNVGPVGTHHTARLTPEEWERMKNAVDAALVEEGIVEETLAITVPLTVLEEGHILSLRQEWLSGEDEDGRKLMLDSSAGWGGDWFALTFVHPDGRRRTEVGRMSEVAQAWARRTEKRLDREVA